MDSLNQISKDGHIIDNKRAGYCSMKDVLNAMAKGSESFKCAVGYFYIEGFIEIIDSLQDLREIKILMGYETTKPTKEELIKAFQMKINQINYNANTVPAIKLFYKLIKEYQTLKIRVYFGTDDKPERLHSKAYLFLRTIEDGWHGDKYRAGIIGSSNLTPSGLVGNTELNTLIKDENDLHSIDCWFEKLWMEGNEEFDQLKISEALIESIEESKFKDEIKNTYLYLEPADFFKKLIKYLNADYLFEDFKKSKLLQFQYVDFLRVVNNFNSKNYRGCFITSSVGLGKSYVASQVAKYFIGNKKKVLIVSPAGLISNEEQWPRYLKEFDIFHNVDLLSMGKLQKLPDIFNLNEYTKDYELIIVDEAHNYRNPDSYRTRNLKKLIDENGNSKVLFLTATPINTSLDDLYNLVKLFHRKGQNNLFDQLVTNLNDLVTKFKNNDYEDMTTSEKEDLSNIQEEIEKEMFVKSTRETIKTSKDYIDELKSFSGVDFTKFADPDVKEVKYELDLHYKDIVNGIVDFITSLSAAHLRLLDPERGIRLSGFFKWILYKRFESDISSYYLTLKRLSKKNETIYLAVDKKDINYLNMNNDDDDLVINFDLEYKDKLNKTIYSKNS